MWRNPVRTLWARDRSVAYLPLLQVNTQETQTFTHAINGVQTYNLSVKAQKSLCGLDCPVIVIGQRIFSLCLFGIGFGFVCGLQTSPLADPFSKRVKLKYKLRNINTQYKTCFYVHFTCNYLRLFRSLYHNWPPSNTQYVITRRHKTDMFLEPNIWT